MTRRQLQAEPALTVLDRLLEEPSAGNPGAPRRQQAQAASIARDLHALLNTRRQEHLVPPQFAHCAASILNFGVPDMTQCGNLQSAGEQARLCRWFEEAIRLFEPRLHNVTVRFAATESRKTLLHFRLEARAEFLASSVAFDMGMRRETGEITVLPS